jgi:mRNA interferase MazF
MPKLGEIYWVDMQYEDDPTSSEYRPVAIIGEDEENLLVLVIELTSQGPKSPYGFYQTLRVPIIHWKSAGLDNFSYGKVNRASVIESSALRSQDYIGELDPSDLDNLMHSYVLYRNYQVNQQPS